MRWNSVDGCIYLTGINTFPSKTRISLIIYLQSFEMKTVKSSLAAICPSYANTMWTIIAVFLSTSWRKYIKKVWSNPLYAIYVTFSEYKLMTLPFALANSLCLSSLKWHMWTQYFLKCCCDCIWREHRQLNVNQTSEWGFLNALLIHNFNILPPTSNLLCNEMPDRNIMQVY